MQPRHHRGRTDEQGGDNTSAVESRGGGWKLLRQLAESTPGGWAGVVVKFGPAWALVAYLLFFLTGTWDGNLLAIGKGVAEIKAEHVQMGNYLRAICVGVNREEVWRCDQGPSR